MDKMARTSNIEAFDLALRRYGDEHIPGRMRDRVNVIVLEGTKSLVEKTPRDRGYAKGNWQVTLNGPAGGEIERFDSAPVGSSAGSPAVRDAEAATEAWKPGDFVWWHNGVPYINVLEHGAQSRAANHMLARTVDHLRRWLRT
jgi:hypothetical protein